MHIAISPAYFTRRCRAQPSCYIHYLEERNSRPTAIRADGRISYFLSAPRDESMMTAAAASPARIASSRKFHATLRESAIVLITDDTEAAWRAPFSCFGLASHLRRHIRGFSTPAAAYPHRACGAMRPGRRRRCLIEVFTAFLRFQSKRLLYAHFAH